MLNIGYKLAMYRKKSGLSQGEAADILQISRATLSKYENGEDLPVDVFVKMAELYDFDVFDVLGVNDPSESVLTDEDVHALTDSHNAYWERKRKRLSALFPDVVSLQDLKNSSEAE